MIHKSGQNLLVACQKTGYQETTKQIAAGTDGMVYGNILTGGLVGLAVDMSDKAAYKYPANIQVPMLPVS